MSDQKLIDYADGLEKYNLILREEVKKLLSNQNEILKICKGHEDLMWSAKIIGIILECDFRDAKQKIEDLK